MSWWKDAFSESYSDEFIAFTSNQNIINLNVFIGFAVVSIRSAEIFLMEFSNSKLPIRSINLRRPLKKGFQDRSRSRVYV